MRLFFVSILSLFYLLLSTGVTLNAHYCMGNLVELKTPWGSNNHSCSNNENHHNSPFSCCIGKEKSNCCDETLIQVKLDIPAISSAHQSLEFKLFSYFISFKKVDFTFEPTTLLNTNFGFYRPPPILQDIRIITHSLLFYH